MLTGDGANITVRFQDAVGMDRHIKGSKEEINEAFKGSAIAGLVSWGKNQDGEPQSQVKKWKEPVWGE